MVRKFQQTFAIALFIIIAFVASFSFLYFLGNLPKYAFGEDFYMRNILFTALFTLCVITPVSCGFTYGFSMVYFKTAEKINSRWLNPFTKC